MRFHSAAAAAIAGSASLWLALIASPSADATSFEDLLKRTVDDVVDETIDKALQPGTKSRKNKQPQPSTAVQQAAGAITGTSIGSGTTVPRPVSQAGGTRAPAVLWQAKLGFRDWGGLVLANGVIVGSNSTNRGGLYAVNASNGELRWKIPPPNSTGESPASNGKFVVVSWTRGSALAAYSLADGREAWSKPFEMVPEGEPVVFGDTVFAQSKDGYLYVFDVATGAERWKRQYSRRKTDCTTGRPALADGVLYLATGIAHPNGGKDDYFLHAIDATNGDEKWRYNPLSKYPDNYGACIKQIVVAGDTVVGAGDEYLYGLDRATGRQKYRVETREETQPVTFYGLVATGDRVFAVSDKQFWAIEAHTGRTAWSLPGNYRRFFPGTAADGNVVYFHGLVAGVDTGPDDGRGVLHAVDASSGQVLWSLKNDTREPWGFDVPVVDRDAIYVGTNGTLLKVAKQ